MVQHALGAQHAADFVDALLDGVGGVLALPPPVVFVVEHLPTVDAARALAVLSPPPALLGLEQGRGLGLDGCVLAQPQPHTCSNAHARARVGVPTGAVGEKVLALLTVQFVEGGGEVQVFSVSFLFPHDRVAVVLIAADEHIFAWVDANDLLFVHVKADMTSRLKGDLWRQVAAVAGGELVEGLGADVAAPEWLGGDDVVEGREGLFHWGTDGGRLITHR